MPDATDDRRLGCLFRSLRSSHRVAEFAFDGSPPRRSLLLRAVTNGNTKAALYVDDIEGMLELETLDRHLFRGRNGTTALDRKHLYGGQVAAQALMAAARTVDSDRLPHSLHGYFLRPGRIDLPVILHVDPDRDGRSFSARHVSAVQDGAVIFSMLASFHRADPSHVLDDLPIASVPPPEACSPWNFDPAIDVREVTLTEWVDDRQLFTDCLWIRTSARLPDDPLVHACALVYLSDLGTGFGRMAKEIGVGGPSIDHTLSFHLPVRADDWVLLDMHPRKATGVRGYYDGTLRDREGTLAAVLTQECLLRTDHPPAQGKREPWDQR